MARSRKKKSVSQHIMNAATIGLPKPAKAVLTNRLVAKLIVLALPLSIAAGILTLDWSGGWPSLSLNPERAEDVREAAAERITTLEDKLPGVLGDWQLPMSRDGGSEAAGQRSPVAGPTDPSAIRIASFNIQVLGTSKAKKKGVMDVLGAVVQGFDVVAVQELRTTDASVMESLRERANADGRAYDFVVGPRLGRTVSKEQYVFLYDTERIEIDPSSILTIADPQDLMHREPLIARFRTRVPNGGTPFTFILMNVHTDPDETKTELDALGDMFVSVQANQWQEDDVILLGDLNVSYAKLGKLGQVPNITYTVRGEPTNTRGTKSYDNIVFDKQNTSEFTGSAGIVDLEQQFGLTNEQALQVSDHFPVWAEFSLVEADGRIAARSSFPVEGGMPAGGSATGGNAGQAKRGRIISLDRLLPGRR